eukprot:m51a1_g10544 hypothetical protein (456) ;mRNA; f:22939-24306
MPRTGGSRVCSLWVAALLTAALTVCSYPLLSPSGPLRSDALSPAEQPPALSSSRQSHSPSSTAPPLSAAASSSSGGPAACDATWRPEVLWSPSNASQSLCPWRWLFNPSPVQRWRPHDGGSDGDGDDDDDLLVLYRARFEGSRVVLRLHGRGGSSGEGPWLAGGGAAASAFGVVADVEPSRATCRSWFKGWDDPRGLSLPDGTLLVVANAPRSGDCLRRMALLEFDERAVREVLRAPERGSKGGAACVVRDVWARNVTFLSAPGEPLATEKNWIPFFPDGVPATRDRVFFVYSVEPHVVLDCNVRLGGRCTEAARTRWPDVWRSVGLRGASVRGSSVAVDRGGSGDFLACAHARVRGNAYKFVLYTFARRHPWQITGVSRAFVVDGSPGARMQYVGGIARALGEWYALGFSVKDKTAQSVLIRQCEVDRMASEFRRASSSSVSSSSDQQQQSSGR